jgi:hypothetical protein
MAAYFTNGGRRAYVVRVAPSDAVAADARVLAQYVDESLETGNGVLTTFSKFAATTAILAKQGLAPIKPGTLSIRYRELGAPVLASVARDRTNAANLQTATGVAHYEGRINPAALPTYDINLDGVVRGTVTVHYSAATVVQNVVVPAGTGSIVTGVLTVGPDTATVIFDHASGRFSLTTTGALVPVLADNAINITVDFTPASATRTVTDNSSGALVGSTIDGTYVTPVTSGSETIGPNAVVYTSGGYNFDVLVAPHNYAKVLVNYTVAAWDINPISVGAWANDVKLTFSGSLDYFTVATAQYTRHDLLVSIRNSETGVFEIVEQFGELSLTDNTSENYFPDLINELSDYIRVVDPGGDLPIPQLSGRSRSLVLAGGNQLAGGQTISDTLVGFPVASRSVSITYTDSGSVVRTITDDGNGNLIGDVDATGTNTINYTTGVINLKTLGTIKGGTLVVAAYYGAPSETAHEERFGDAAKQFTLGPVNFYAAGTNGTYNSTYWGRAQFSSPLLIPASKGLYALSRVDDLLQVGLPDYAGDVVISGDLLDYAATRASQPSGGDRFIILTTPKGQDPQEAVDWLRYTFARNSDYASIYWPWIKVADPLANNRPLLIPPIAHLAGIYARTDSSKNVAKTPAGTVDGALQFLLGLEYVATQGERDLVYPNKINPLISSPQTGFAVWGGRTISIQPQWKYINARRLFMFLEKSIFNDTFWIVFEDNGPGLWSRITIQLSGFLNFLFSERYFAGSTPSQGFFVVCNEDNNTAATINQGQVIVDVGAAPHKPAEFVRIRFAQITQA